MILVDRRKSLLLIVFIATLFSLLLINRNSSDLRQTIIEGPAMGTQYKIVIKSNKDINSDTIKNAVESILININNQMSTYQLDSEISKFNFANDKDRFSGIDISDHFLEVINKSFYYYTISEGVFDITIYPLYELWGFQNKNLLSDEPSELEVNKSLSLIGMDKLDVKNKQLSTNYSGLSIDVSAIAKGYTVDVIFDYLKNQDYSDFFIDIGGEIRVSSANSNSWSIGIQEPNIDRLGEVNAKIKLSNNSIATSGNYANFIDYLNSEIARTHIINPKTGYPLEIRDGIISSASIIAPLCVDADALATILMLFDKDEGLKLIESLDNTEAYLIYYKSGKLHTVQSSGFNQYLYE